MELRKVWKGKDWIATFGGYHSVQAPSKVEARELAYRTMEAMIDQDYRPRVLIYGNQTGVAWRTPTGWCYGISSDDADGRVSYPCTASGDWKTADDVERNMRSHMAQTATVAGTALEDHSAFILHDDDRADYLRWLQWQRSVREALDKGLDMEAAREYADRQRYAA